MKGNRIEISCPNSGQGERSSRYGCPEIYYDDLTASEWISSCFESFVKTVSRWAGRSGVEIYVALAVVAVSVMASLGFRLRRRRTSSISPALPQGGENPEVFSTLSVTSTFLENRDDTDDTDEHNYGEYFPIVNPDEFVRQPQRQLSDIQRLTGSVADLGLSLSHGNYGGAQRTSTVGSTALPSTRTLGGSSAEILVSRSSPINNSGVDHLIHASAGFPNYSSGNNPIRENGPESSQSSATIVNNGDISGKVS